MFCLCQRQIYTYSAHRAQRGHDSDGISDSSSTLPLPTSYMSTDPTPSSSAAQRTAAETVRPRRRSQFRPCIDLHQGVVKQIVGGTLDLDAEASVDVEGDKQGAGARDKGLKTNFVAA